MDKIISFAIPCYNSAGYMRKCIDFLVAVGDEIEVIIYNKKKYVKINNF